MKEEDAKKFISYVGHESSVNGLNLFFGVVSVETDFEKYRKNQYRHESCNFGAYVNFELYQDKETKDLYIKYVFDGEPVIYYYKYILLKEWGWEVKL